MISKLMRERSPVADLPTGLRQLLRPSKRPSWIAPMLATLAEQRFSCEGWLFEPKFDGERCLAIRFGSDVQLLSRNQKQLNGKCPELVEVFRAQKPGSFTVDGEIVTFEDGVTSFAKLQQRMQIQHPSQDLRRKVPVWLYAFDLLYLDGFDTRQLPLRKRKELLRKVFEFKDPLRFTDHRETEGESYYREACHQGWEGIIAKSGDSTYVSARSRDWLKFKCVNEQEFVIGGYTEPKGQRIGFGALLVGYFDAEKLIYAGKVGTGYDTSILRRLGKELAGLQTRACPFAVNQLPSREVHWVKPTLVAQIGFAEWTSGGKLRQPRFLGLRSDKQPQAVVRE